MSYPIINPGPPVSGGYFENEFGFPEHQPLGWDYFQPLPMQPWSFASLQPDSTGYSVEATPAPNGAGYDSGHNPEGCSSFLDWWGW